MIPAIHWRALAIPLLAFALAWPAHAQKIAANDILQIENRLKDLDNATQTISEASGDEVFDQLRADIDKERTRAVACVSDMESAVKGLKREREILAPGSAPPAAGGAVPATAGQAVSPVTAEQGSAPPAEPAESAALDKRRKALKSELGELEERQALCQLLTLRADQLLERVNTVYQQKLARQLLARGPNVLEVAYANLYHPQEWWDFTADVMLSASGAQDMGARDLMLMVALGLLGFAAGVRVRRRLAPVPGTEAPVIATTLGRLAWSLRACGIRFAPVLLTLAAVSLFLWLRVDTGAQPPFINFLAYGLLALAVAILLTRALLRPCRPAKQVFGLSAEIAHPLNQRLQVLWLVMLVGSLLFYTPMVKAFHEDTYLLARDVYIAFLVANTVWVIWLAGKLSFFRSHWLVRALLVMVFATVLGAELLGYRNLAGAVVRSALLTLYAAGLMLILMKVLEEAFDSLDEGSGRMSLAIRRGLGLSTGDYVPGLGWLRLVIILGMWLAFLALLLFIWGLSDEGFRVIYRYVAEGFTIGNFQLVPGQLVGAVLVFALLLTLTGWLKNQLDQRWLSKVRMDRGAKEALVTTSGYVGVALAILFGLSMAGLELTNLALIAGALSVGIGFGLQNVVNNFVSGLILLMERPIRTGDWIVVGNTEGYVRRISIRSTRIQTFDRADVIVPNSEIISNQVTNWMLSDPYGRLKMPVGVAYGSDVEKVKSIMLAAATDHPLVVHGIIGLMDPRVLFVGFGDSSLDFELWCMLREVDTRVAVKSDLYFTIEQAFRDNGIEIPFPQRDLHVRTWTPPSKNTPEG